MKQTLAHDKPMTDLAKVLRQDALYPHPERLVTFIGNHDTSRFITEAGGSAARLKLALGLLATLRGMPELYSGDEIAMPGGADPDNRHDFPGGFPLDARNAFTREGRTDTEQEIFAWTFGLLRLRQQQPVLQTGIEQNLFADEDAFVFLRAGEDKGCSREDAAAPAQARFLIVVNKGKSGKQIDLSTEDTALAGCTQFSIALPTVGSAPVVRDGMLKLDEPADSMTVFEVR